MAAAWEAWAAWVAAAWAAAVVLKPAAAVWGGMGGGGMGGVWAMGGGMGGGGMGGGGFMRVPPERMRKLTVTTVCLEHGKQDPNPKIPYKMVPLEEFTDNPRVKVLCEALGYGQVTQNTAQAAAWHMMDGLTWQELAAKNRVESKYTGNVRWFSPIELQTAMAVVNTASKIAEDRGEVAKPSTKPRRYKSGYDQSPGAKPRG